MLTDRTIWGLLQQQVARELDRRIEHGGFSLRISHDGITTLSLTMTPQGDFTLGVFVDFSPKSPAASDTSSFPTCRQAATSPTGSTSEEPSKS
jgi:hypothetical protein